MARNRKDISAGIESHLLQLTIFMTRSSNLMALVYLIPMQASWFVTTQQTLTFAIIEIFLSPSIKQQEV